MTPKILQKLSCAGVAKIPDEMCKRAWLHPGSFCNYKCVFCYYQNDLTKQKSTETVKREILGFKNAGFTSVDLSGGEVTIRKDFFELIKFCKEQFGKASIISNGYKLSNFDFAKKAYESGLNEVLLSLHGSCAHDYESITQIPGSFDKIIKAAKNCKKLGMTVRFNCTACDLNTTGNPNDFAELIQELNPFEVNFIHVNAFDENRDYKFSNYSNIIKYVKTIIDKLSKESPEIIINFRYVPFCHMQGYEKYVTGYYQHIFDIYDWNPYSWTFGQMGLKPFVNDNEFLRSSYSACKVERERNFSKTEKCSECKYFYICDGLKHGLSEDVFPVKGDIIHDPCYFRHSVFK